MRLRAGAFAVAVLAVAVACGSRAESSGGLPACEWCGVAEGPATPDWQTTIAGSDETAEALVLSGTIFGRDGRPARDVVLYVWHTNARGIYPKRGGERGNAQRHGYLRGWVKSGADGRYRIRTIRPGPYPGGSEAAHIHMTLKTPDGVESYFDTIHFAGDPLLRETARSAPSTIPLVRDGKGVWQGKFDVDLSRVRQEDGR